MLDLNYIYFSFDKTNIYVKFSSDAFIWREGSINLRHLTSFTVRTINYPRKLIGLTHLVCVFLVPVYNCNFFVFFWNIILELEIKISSKHEESKILVKIESWDKLRLPEFDKIEYAKILSYLAISVIATVINFSTFIIFLNYFQIHFLTGLTVNIDPNHIPHLIKIGDIIQY